LPALAVCAAAVIIFGACQGAGVTASPSTAATATTAATVAATPTDTGTPVASPSASESPSESASESPSESASASPSESASGSASASAPASPAGPTGTPYPSAGAQPPAPAEGITEYPNYGGEVDCKAGTFNGLPYGGNLKKIKAVDPKTVEFDFCNPDVAFLSQIAFSALAINDAGYLIANMGSTPGSGKILDTPNGTGPYKLQSWDKGSRMDFVANPDYWGAKALTPNLEFQWSDQAAARLTALQAGTVDGIDNPGKGDIATIKGDANLKFYPREGLNTFYLGMNNQDKPWNNIKVRQAIAMGIDRQKLVDNYYPPGSEVATYFTPCAIPFACKGDKWYGFDAAAAKTLLQQGLQEEGLDLATWRPEIQFRKAVRGYLPDPPTIAQAIADQLQTNLGITVKSPLVAQDSGTFLDNNAAGKLDGLFMLGWGADFPDASNFLDYHFGPGAGVKFGKPFDDLVAAVKKGDQSAKDADRETAYTTANNLIKKYVPAVIVAHGGSGAAYKSDVKNAFAAPLLENFNVMQAASRDTLVFMQNAEPLSLYCADETDGETLRACGQIQESLYQYKPGGTETQPALATKCTPNADLTVWTCTLRDGVKFHQGQTLTADDVILSFAAQWDNLSPLHQGRTAAFEYWDSLIGQGKLNPPGPCGLANTPACKP
jgi:ABC-type transport system substrate-binding protein